ncbi:MAG: trans-sialidase [Nitrosopumilus sp.]|uniref:trans-sialidase n=1 Tax=Nitrosopumilus sp. TaxID=2024843 RepID=UPI00242C245F|nr:trans-sialidase [Nitrosopumilus sp.]MCV0367139.1 trans-sialidase [Nitrosopumilus sp.]
MAAKRKASTKKDLEDKIAELEAKLTKLSTQLEAKPAPKPAETKPAEAKPAEAKPAETKPAEKPAATTKPKGTLPKGFEKPAEAPKPQDAPKPAETTSQPPATVQDALENAYYTAPMTDFHQYRAKVTGYSPAPNRYFVRLTAPVGKVPTRNWNDQKATVTGYTAPSNQYFATRQRLAYHPADKRFGSFSGVNMSVEGVTAQVQSPPPEPPKPAKGTLPKGMGQPQQTPQQQTNYGGNEGKSRKELLEEYENEYLQRIERERIEQEQAYLESVAAEAKAKSASQTKRGALPKGFEPQPEPEAPKASKGTLPKGF